MIDPLDAALVAEGTLTITQAGNESECVSAHCESGDLPCYAKCKLSANASLPGVSYYVPFAERELPRQYSNKVPLLYPDGATCAPLAQRGSFCPGGGSVLSTYLRLFK